MMKNLGINEIKNYREALIEVLADAFPKIGTSIREWGIDVTTGGDEDVI
jgi:hypothetical protein